MLPTGSLNSLYYPMTADVYYASSSQNSFGEITKTWSKNRSIACSAIKENPASSMRSAVSLEKFIEYDIKINMRTNENIFKSSSGTSYELTDILISNIKDPIGTVAWIEKDGDPTNFEVDTVEPMFDEFHNVGGYRVLLKRSDLQVDV